MGNSKLSGATVVFWLLTVALSVGVGAWLMGPENVGKRLRRECEQIMSAAADVARSGVGMSVSGYNNGVFTCLVESATKGRR